MPGDDSKPTFLLLRARCPAMTPSQFIGRFVLDPCRPLDGYAPKDPSSLIAQEIVATTEEHTDDVIDTKSSGNARVRLQQLAHIGAGAGQKQKTTIKSAYIKTYRLENHPSAFHSLQDAPSVQQDLDGPRGLFTYSKGKLYMIVGFKTFSPGTIMTAKRSGGGGLKAGLTIPLSALITGLPLNIDPEVSGGVQKEHAHTHKYTTLDEEIFAVEYRIVTRPNMFGFYAKTAEIKLDRKIMTHGWDNAVYDSGTGDEDAEGIFDEDDDEEESAKEVLQEQAKQEATERNEPKSLFEIHDTELTQEDVGQEDLLLLE